MTLYVERTTTSFGNVWSLLDDDWTDEPVSRAVRCDAIDIIATAANRAWERGAPGCDRWFNELRMHKRPDIDYYGRQPQ